MFTLSSRRRHTTLPALLVLAIFSLALLAPILDVTAQTIRTNPTPTPTEEFDPGFAAQPTEEPTREPERVPPTEVPVPTDEPEPAAPSSLTLNKGACDDTNFDPYTATGLDAFLDACSSPDGEFEFTVSNNVAFNTTQSTELGTLFMQVPTGPITITETIAAGWGDPAVFCWSNLLPTPSAAPFIGNSPVWDVQEGEDIECWWFNVSEPAGHSIRVEKRTCPDGFVVPEDYWTLANGCQDTASGVDFAMTVDDGTVGGTTDANGQIEWAGVNLGASGQVQIQETIPEGYGEPIVWCVNFPVEAADAQDFDFFQVESVDGLIAAIPEQDAPFIFSCTYFNVLADGGAPGDLTDPSSVEGGEEVEHQITLTKRTCPAGTDPDAGLGALLGACAMTPGVEFTLEYGGGATSTTETDASGVVSWDGIPYGEFEILETNHANYAMQSAHCQFEDLPGPGAWIYDFTDGTYDGSFDLGLDPEDGPIHLACDWFNFEDGEGVNVTVVKHRCPLGVPEDATLDQYVVICTDPHESIPFTLDHAGGSFPGATGDDGQVEWTGVPAGEIGIQEDIPEGYKDPLVFCISFDGEQELENGQVIATGGLIELDIPDEATAVVCYVFNIPDPEQATSLTINKWRCPIGFDEDALDPETHCTEPMDGVTFHLGDLAATTGEFVPGVAQFSDIPPGDHDLTEEAPAGIDHAVIGGCSLNGEAQALLLGETKFPSTTLEIEPGSHWTCEWYNVPAVESRVLVNKRICADDVDLVLTEDNTIGEIIDACPTEGNGIEFTLDHAGGSSTQETADGFTMWDGIANGPITITETIPAGYLEPVWYCFSNPYDEAGELTLGAHIWALANAPGGVLPEALDEEFGEIFSCWVFNVPGDGNSLTVVKRLCPANFDLEAGDPEAECTEPMGGVTFTLGDMEATTGDDQGVAVFEDIPAGDDYQHTEILPEGTVHAWISHCSLPGSPGLIPLSEEMPPIALLDFDEGDHWTCYWYNVPEEQEPSITIEKYFCPVGYDLDAPMADPVSDCTLLLNGVTFNLDDGNPPDPDQSRQTGDDGPGVVIFPDLEPGTWTVTEEVPAGIVDAAAWCPTITGNPQVFDDPPRAVFEVAEGDQFHCLWFNVPEEVEENTVIINKWECPEGIAVWESHHTLSTNCVTPHDGVEFEITTDFGWVAMETFGGTLQLGPIGPMFHVEIQEDIPAGFGDPAVYCAVDDDPHMQIGAPGGYWEHDFADDDVAETLTCEVYNIPDEENTVIIRKWQCPEGTGHEESVDWYGDNCIVQHDGIDFKVASDIGIAVAETSMGEVQFDGLPAGGVSIQETIPDGFGPPVVVCGVNGLGWQEFPAPTGHWEHDFPDDGVSDTLTCYVYNIPGEPPDLTILKWTCPEGYDLFAAGADPATDCTEANNGITFELRIEGNPALLASQTTGDVIDGGVIFDDLEPDLYNVFELVPEGIASVFVLECTGHIMGVLQPYPLQFGPVLDDIDLDAGEHLVCHWYNVPDDEGGDLTLIKYTCTTEEFVSEVDCQVEEDGKTFDLFYWSGTWDLVGTETTDGFGRIGWTGLPDGEYWFEEHDGAWCHIASDQLYEDGPWVVVPEGEETVVHVYNCDGTPGDPGDTPTKYPNTGVPPAPATPTSAPRRGRRWDTPTTTNLSIRRGRATGRHSRLRPAWARPSFTGGRYGPYGGQSSPPARPATR